MVYLLDTDTCTIVIHGPTARPSTEYPRLQCGKNDGRTGKWESNHMPLASLCVAVGCCVCVAARAVEGGRVVHSY